jgi:prevent-host-death family protein
MKEVALSEVKDDLSRYLRQAAKEEIVITRHGKAAGVLIGFESDDDWFDYRLENDPRFLDRIAAARASLRAGRGVRLEDIGNESTAEQGAPADRGSRRSRPKRTVSRRGRAGR